MARPHVNFQFLPTPVLVEGRSRSYECELMLPKHPRGQVVLADGKGVEENFCAAMIDALFEAEIAVLRLPAEPSLDGDDAPQDTVALDEALRAACAWADQEPWAAGLAQGLFGVGAMAAPMLLRATLAPQPLRAVVIVEGMADMSEADLEEVRVPTLFIADGTDPIDSELHQEVAALLRCESKVILLDRLLIPPSTAVDWYLDHFRSYDDQGRGSAPRRQGPSALDFPRPLEV
jgi:hypothetical protein